VRGWEGEKWVRRGQVNQVSESVVAGMGWGFGGIFGSSVLREGSFGVVGCHLYPVELLGPVFSASCFGMEVEQIRCPTRSLHGLPESSFVQLLRTLLPTPLSQDSVDFGQLCSVWRRRV